MSKISELQLNTLYDEMAVIYPRITKPDEYTARQFLRVFDGYSYFELKAAFESYATKESKTPYPADLIKQAKFNREKAYMRRNQQGGISYDSNGDKVWNCPYCQDTGYMEIYLPDDQYPVLMATCIHNHPGALAQLKQHGVFGYNDRKHKIRERLVWIPARRLFAPEGSCVPEWEQSHYSDSAKLTAAEDLTAAAVDLFGGKV